MDILTPNSLCLARNRSFLIPVRIIERPKKSLEESKMLVNAYNHVHNILRLSVVEQIFCHHKWNEVQTLVMNWYIWVTWRMTWALGKLGNINKSQTFIELLPSA